MSEFETMTNQHGGSRPVTRPDDKRTQTKSGYTKPVRMRFMSKREENKLSEFSPREKVEALLMLKSHLYCKIEVTNGIYAYDELSAYNIMAVAEDEAVFVNLTESIKAKEILSKKNLLKSEKSHI